MNCVYCTTLNKYYSFLYHFAHLDFEKKEFYLISEIDALLSSFRSITFTIQKNFKKIDKNLEIYEKYKDKYFVNDSFMTFMNNERNKNIHEGSELEVKKTFEVYVHSSNNLQEKILEFSFDVFDEINLDNLLAEITKVLLLKNNVLETLFSIKYVIYYGNQELAILDYFKYSMKKISNFLNDFITETMNKLHLSLCDKCNNLLKKANQDLLPIIYKINMNLDYIFDHESKKITGFDQTEYAFFSNSGMYIGAFSDHKVPIDTFLNTIKIKGKEEIFLNWVYTNLFLYFYQSKNLIPVFLLFWNDKTVSIDFFPLVNSSILYRKILQLEKLALNKKLEGFIYTAEVNMASNEKDILEYAKLKYDEKKAWQKEIGLEFIFCYPKMNTDQYAIVDVTNANSASDILENPKWIEIYNDERLIHSTFKNLIKLLKNNK